MWLKRVTVSKPHFHLNCCPPFTLCWSIFSLHPHFFFSSSMNGKNSDLFMLATLSTSCIVINTINYYQWHKINYITNLFSFQPEIYLCHHIPQCSTQAIIEAYGILSQSVDCSGLDQQESEVVCNTLQDVVRLNHYCFNCFSSWHHIISMASRKMINGNLINYGLINFWWGNAQRTVRVFLLGKHSSNARIWPPNKIFFLVRRGE